MAAVAGVGLAASLAQTLFSALQTNKDVKAMCSMFKCESQPQQLEETVGTIKALLLDVDQKRQGLTNEGQLWVEKLKDAVYDIAFNVSREIKMLREKLEAIAKNHRDYGFKVVSDQVQKRPETWSYISDQEIIGREDDKEAIVGTLLSNDSHSSNRNVSFVVRSIGP